MVKLHSQCSTKGVSSKYLEIYSEIRLFLDEIMEEMEIGGRMNVLGL